MGNFQRKTGNLLLIDGNSLAYRWFSRPTALAEAYPMTALSFAGSFAADKIVVCFDYGKSEYRMSLLPDYKGNRGTDDPEQKAQREIFFENLKLAQEALIEAGVTVIKEYGVEADDIIYQLVQDYSYNYNKTYIVSSDKDLFQLLNNDVIIFSPYHNEERDNLWLFETLNCSPEEYLLALILSGDTSDNIQGITGLGEPKKDTARSLKYAKLGDTIDEIIEKVKSKAKKGIIDQRILDNIEQLKLNEQLIDLSKARLSNKQLATIRGTFND